MGIWDNFDTKYEGVSPYVLLGLENQMNGASHAALGSDIGKVLQSLQNAVSKANTNEYARQLEMMTPDQVLAMEARGLDPRTAKLGNGFIYDPENQAIKDTFTKLKTKVGTDITGRVKRSNDRLTQTDIKKLREKGVITPEDLLALAGIGSSAYTNRADIQTQANALNKAFDDKAVAEGMALLQGTPITDNRVKALWNGDNSFFTNNGYTAEDAAVFGDALRNNAEAKKLINDKLKYLYEREQTQNATNGQAIQNAADWLSQFGISNASLNDIDPATKEFADTRKRLTEEENKVQTESAIQNLRQNLSLGKVDLKNLQRLYTTATNEDLAAWEQSAEGNQVLNQLKNQYLTKIQLEQGKIWDTLIDPNESPAIQQAALRHLDSAIDKELANAGLGNIPKVKTMLMQMIESERNQAISSQLFNANAGLEEELANTAQAFNTAKTQRSEYTDIVKDLNKMIEGSEVDPSRYNLSSSQKRQLQSRIQDRVDKLMEEILGLTDAKSAENAEFRNMLYSAIEKDLLDKTVRRMWGNEALGSYLEKDQSMSDVVAGNSMHPIDNALYSPTDLTNYLLGDKDIANSILNNNGGALETLKEAIRSGYGYYNAKKKFNANKTQMNRWVTK